MIGNIPILIVTITVVAVTLDALFMWPQAVKLLKTLDTAGVSALTWTFGLAFSAMWAAYAGTINMTFLMLSNISCVAASLLVLACGTKAGWSKKYITLGLSCGGLSVLIAVYIPTLAVGLLTLGAILFIVPQLVRILKADKLTGISAATWWLNIIVSSAWLTVAIYENENGVILANTASIIALLGVIGSLYIRKNKLKTYTKTRLVTSK